MPVASIPSRVYFWTRDEFAMIARRNNLKLTQVQMELKEREDPAAVFQKRKRLQGSPDRRSVDEYDISSGTLIVRVTRVLRFVTMTTFFQREDCKSQYTIGDVLGTGSFAVVRKAVSKSDGSVWAVKVS
jgi:serine/threonine protein kinase